MKIISLVILLCLSSVFSKSVTSEQKANIPNGILNREVLEQIYGANLYQIKDINLSNSNIIDIEEDTFVGLTNVINLDLSHNNIDHMRHGAFDGLENMLTFDLSFNQLDYIDHEDFHELVSLVELNLSNNKIDTIDLRSVFTLFPN